MAWLEARHSVVYRPQLATDERALRHSTDTVRAVVLPNSVVVNQDFLEFSPHLQVIGRMQIGSDNVDLEACRERGIQVLQARGANVRANAEFLLGSLVMLYRQGILASVKSAASPNVPSSQRANKLQAPPPQLGREINGSTIGLLGVSQTGTLLASLLNSLGARVIGYDPALHHSSPIWQQIRVQPVSLVELMGTADAVSVQMMYASRFKGFISERVLACCKKQQIWVSIARSSLFDMPAMAQAMQDGRIGAWLTDSSDESDRDALQLLRSFPHFYATHRIGSMTHEARQRASWYMAHRLHDILSPEDSDKDRVNSRAMALSLPGEATPSNWTNSTHPASPSRPAK
jgi:phosphoglycerate dehydrogenase-like enzyme